MFEISWTGSSIVYGDVGVLSGEVTSGGNATYCVDGEELERAKRHSGTNNAAV